MTNKDKATEIALRNARAFASIDLNALVNDSSVAECEKSALNGIDWKEQQLTDWLLRNAEKYVKDGRLMLNDMIENMLNDN